MYFPLPYDFLFIVPHTEVFPILPFRSTSTLMKLDIYVQYHLEENLAQLTKIQISRFAFPVLQRAIRIYL